MRTFFAIMAFMMWAGSPAFAQNSEPHYRGQGYVYYGMGTGLWEAGDHPFVNQVGFGGEGFLFKGLGFGGEAGYTRWERQQAWIGSADFSYHFRRHATRGQLDPFACIGFSVFGPTSADGGRGEPAINVAGGVNLWLWKHAALRFEARDYVNSGYYVPGYQYLSFRVGMTFR